MATEPTIAILNGACKAQENRAATFFATVSDYWALTKPEVNFLILITTFAGFCVASISGAVNFHSLLAFHTLLAAYRQRYDRDPYSDGHAGA
jgi:heme O synthase-like polyprenyltransferase